MLHGEVVFELVREDAKVPTRATIGSAGYDCSAHIAGRTVRLWTRYLGDYTLRIFPEALEVAVETSLTLFPTDRALIPLGFRARLPHGFEGQLRARSGLALKHGIGLVNGVGTIDEDYPDEWAALVVNHGLVPFTIEHGTRIAQLVIARYYVFPWYTGDVVPLTDRAGGFGHTGC